MAQLRLHDHVLGRHIHALWKGRFRKKGERIAYKWFRLFHRTMHRRPPLSPASSLASDEGAGHYTTMVIKHYAGFAGIVSAKMPAAILDRQD